MRERVRFPAPFDARLEHPTTPLSLSLIQPFSPPPPLKMPPPDNPTRLGPRHPSPRPLKTSRPQDSAADIIRMRRFEDPMTDVAHIVRGQPMDGSYGRRMPYLLPFILALIFTKRDLSLAGFASPLVHILSHAFIVEYLYLDHLLSI